ncbi:MAG: hypothetical protein E6J90_40860 [Deltaproteobacteria bacterium]|nr:MAG: hypothetical protein E6J90_40860 [Deltaproteobacteria bacterium]
MLESQLIYVRHHCIRLEYILNQRNLIPSAEPTLVLHDVLDRLAQTIVGLESRVVMLDNRIFGAAVGSLGELLLRAQTAVITLQLQRLRPVLRYGEHKEDLLLEGSQYRTLEEVIDFMDMKIRRINAVVLGHRIPWRISHEASVPTVQQQLHHRAIRNAQNGMRSIADAPGVAHLLRAGIMRSDWPELQSACAHIATMFVISLDVGMDHALFLSRSVVRQYGTVESPTWS